MNARSIFFFYTSFPICVFSWFSDFDLKATWKMFLFHGKKRGAPQAATLAVCAQVLRTHMQSAVRRALEAADSFYHGVVGGMSAFLFEKYLFF